MPKKKKRYTLHQFKLLQQAAERQVEKLGSQKKLALAMDISQQSVADLIGGTYWPAPSKAEHLATLEKFESLEEMIGKYDDVEAPVTPPTIKGKKGTARLEACLLFYQGTKQWSPWTIAAARARYFQDDVPAPAWAARLDKLESTLAPAKVAR
jgi:hypothetical protein